MRTKKQSMATKRNWEIFTAKGNIALWSNFCKKYDIVFDKNETEKLVIDIIKARYDDISNNRI